MLAARRAAWRGAEARPETDALVVRLGAAFGGARSRLSSWSAIRSTFGALSPQSVARSAQPGAGERLAVVSSKYRGAGTARAICALAETTGREATASDPVCPLSAVNQGNAMATTAIQNEHLNTKSNMTAPHRVARSLGRSGG